MRHLLLFFVLFVVVSATAQKKDSEPEVFLYAGGAFTASLGLNMLNGLDNNSISNQKVVKCSVKLITLSVFSFTTAITIDWYENKQRVKHSEYDYTVY
jgi:hypothetical protein